MKRKRAQSNIRPGTLKHILSVIEGGDCEKAKGALEVFDLTSFLPHRRDKNVWTLLNAAVTRRNTPMTTLLCKKFPKVNFSLDVGDPLILTAIDEQDFETIAVLVEFGVDFNINYKKAAMTPLCAVMNLGLVETVNFFLKKGADPNFPDVCKRTPLHFAVSIENLDFIKLLLDRGGDPNFEDTNKQTPFSFAVEKGNFDMIKEMLEKGANPKIQSADGQQTPLHVATKNGQLEIVKLLVTKGADIEAIDSGRKRPLHYAASGKHVEIVRYLLEKNATVNSQDDAKETPLMMAITAEEKTIVELLLRKGANIELQALSSLRALHYASYGDLEILKVLLQTDVERNSEDSNGFTPLFYAAKHQKLENVKILLKLGAQFSSKYKNDFLRRLAAVSTPEILKLIFLHHPKLHFKMKKNVKGICYCGDCNRIESLKNISFLIGCGLDVNARIEYNRNEPTIGRLLIHAVAESEAAVVDLLDAGADVNRESEYYILPRKSTGGRAPRAYFPHVRSVISPLFAILYIYSSNYDSDEEHIVTRLLCHGADINILPKDFKTMFFFKYCGLCESTRELLRHIAIMRDQKLKVDERILKEINTEEDLREFYEECEEEIKKLKTENFGKTSSTFFDVLTKSRRQLATFARNTSISNGSKAKDKYGKMFPIYGTAITLKLEIGLKRKKLLNEALKYSNLLFPPLPPACCDEIFSYLPNRDVGVLIDICQGAAKK